MNRDMTASRLPEQMGLRLEETARLNLLDGVLLAALMLSGIGWIWTSVVGIEPGLLAALGSPAGRLSAALVGLASIGAAFRAFLVSRWPVSESDRSLV